MTAKRFLMQYQKLTWDIERLERDIRDIEESIDSMQINYDGMPRGNKISRKPEDLAIKLSTLKGKKQASLTKAWQKREEITKAIAKIENATLSRLLYDRYIELMTWEATAEDIHKSEYWTRTELHSQALKAIDIIINS